MQEHLDAAEFAAFYVTKIICCNLDLDFCVLFLFPDCLRSFTDLEELDETELYMCHKCKKKQKSTKKFWIQKLPKVCINMKSKSMAACQRNSCSAVPGPTPEPSR